jgi:hypothetical protein
MRLGVGIASTLEDVSCKFEVTCMLKVMAGTTYIRRFLRIPNPYMS